MLGQEELLEDEADPAGPESGEFTVGEQGHVEAGDPHRATGRTVEGSHDVQEGRLARSRGPDDGDEFAVCDGEGHSRQRSDRRLARVLLRHILQFEDCRSRPVRGTHEPGTTMRCPATTPRPNTWTTPSASSKMPSVTGS